MKPYQEKLTPAKALEHAMAFVATMSEDNITEYMTQLDEDIRAAEREVKEMYLMRGAMLLAQAWGRKVA